MATRTLLGFRDETEAEDVLLIPNSIGFTPTTPRTASTITCRRCRVRHPRCRLSRQRHPRPRRLALVRLPTGSAAADGVCNGRYYSCARREEILAFHRRLIEFGRHGGPLTAAPAAAASRPARPHCVGAHWWQTAPDGSLAPSRKESPLSSPNPHAAPPQDGAPGETRSFRGRPVLNEERGLERLVGALAAGAGGARSRLGGHLCR